MQWKALKRVAMLVLAAMLCLPGIQEHHAPRIPIDPHPPASSEAGRGLRHTHHGRDPEESGQNGGVEDLSTEVGDES